MSDKLQNGFFFILLPISLFVIWAMGLIYHGTCGEVRGQKAGVNSLLLPQRSNIRLG